MIAGSLLIIYGVQDWILIGIRYLRYRLQLSLVCIIWEE